MHSWHCDSPPSAWKPGVQRVGTEEPLHEKPTPHAWHVVRVFASVPPEVNDPATHDLQDAAPFPLYFLSLLHFVHEDLPLPENVPALHCGFDELPLQRLPAGHTVHAVRLLAEPPEVNEPDLHVLQDAAPLPLYFLSLLHFVHEDLPLPENVPAPHCGFAELPLQRWPAGQMPQAERVAVAPPDVKLPEEQVLQTPAPWAAKLLSSPHGVVA